MLDLAASGPDCFIGTSIAMALPRVFGGQVLAQGLVAAAQTVDDGKTAHSLHAYFLRAGDPDEPIEYRVDRVRDGRQLSCRAVSALQHGRAIATILCSFAATSDGVTHQRRVPSTASAAALPTLIEATAQWGGLSPEWSGFNALEIRVQPRHVDPTSEVEDPGAVFDHIWQRVPYRLPDDAVLHQAMLVYASDICQLAAALVPHGVPIGIEKVGDHRWDGVSVDHVVWFHRPCRADEWLLFEQCAPSAGAGRALTRSDVFTADGVLVASIAQEGLIWNAAARATDHD